MLVSSGSPSRKSASGEPVACPVKVKGPGGVRTAQKVAVNAPGIAAEAQVVLAVNPTQRLAEGDGLRHRKAWLLLAQSRQVAQHHIGQAVIERAGIERRAARTQNAVLGGNIGDAGKEVCRLAGAAVPVAIEDAGQLVVAHRIAGLHGVRVRGTLAAQLRKQVHIVAGRVAPVVVEVDALAQTHSLQPAPAESAEPPRPPPSSVAFLPRLRM